MIGVAIAGLGRAGARYENVDAGKEGQTVIRNHLDAVLSIPDFAPVALIDPDFGACKAVAARQPQLSPDIFMRNIDDLILESADVIAVCGPTVSRKRDVLVALEKRPRVLIVEKPLAPDLGEGEELVRRAEELGIPLRVNFHRRLDPAHRRFREAFPGAPQLVVFRYGKGLYNYASHLIDLLLDWFGPIDSVQAIGRPSKVPDPTVSFRCRMAAGFDAFAIGVDGLEYDQFEGEFLFPDRRMELANGGTEKRCYKPIGDLYYPGYAQLGAPEELEAPWPVGGFRELYEVIRDHLNQGMLLPGCEGVDALAGLAIQEAVMRSVAAGGVEVEPSMRTHNIFGEG